MIMISGFVVAVVSECFATPGYQNIGQIALLSQFLFSFSSPLIANRNADTLPMPSTRSIISLPI
jgi:hypothetical protein